MDSVIKISRYQKHTRIRVTRYS
ncbi:hypothetical protein TSAR_010799 [Trichomalopsis sarcophagae]|uniref:Uncharacterized protein n=1 Tax=Trichomalopsis sarcophagae TaxID=543379 RepID=A0A232FH34_9HYME|nr:hypothetical protein TSAR_010799 [Trichomalopsis sarcophagae]